MKPRIVAMSPLPHVLAAIVLSGGAIVISWQQAATPPAWAAAYQG
jgi:hypothetical protein